VLTLRRNGKLLVQEVKPVGESFHESLLEATQRSVRRLDVEGRRVGYVHLWSCTGRQGIGAFTRIIRDSLAHMDGVILDLRDGYGGAWFEYLDPFFKDRREFAVITARHQSGDPIAIPPKVVIPHPWFRGPLVAIVNEGTRSGKEGMAYQLKKTGRARLVGSRTAGAFSGGKTILPAGQSSYVLYVAYTWLLLDGEALEGRGVVPDIEVPYPLGRSVEGDPQLERAIEEMRMLLVHDR